MKGFGWYQEIRKLDDQVKICFLTSASDVYYEAFGEQAFHNIVDKTNKVNYMLDLDV